MKKRRLRQVTILLVLALVFVLVSAKYALPHITGGRAIRGGAVDSAARAEGLKGHDRALSSISAASAVSPGSRRSPQVQADPSDVSAKSAGTSTTDANEHKVLFAYHRAARCREYANTKLKVSHMPKPSEVGSPEYSEEIVRQLDHMDAILQKYSEQCEALSPEDIDKNLFEFSKEAGLDGDPGAQACFVHGVAFRSGGYGSNGDWKKEYLTHAPRFMEHGINTGYWPTVSAAVQILMDSFDQLPPWLSDLPQPDPYRVYRAVRLTYYRSDNKGIATLEYVLETLASRYHISSRQVAEADRWAQEVYRQRFADTPVLSPWESEDCP